MPKVFRCDPRDDSYRDKMWIRIASSELRYFFAKALMSASVTDL
jgi:hypothetical protein